MTKKPETSSETFPSTSWRLLKEACANDGRGSLERLLVIYYRPMLRFVLWRFSLSVDDGEDLVQDFVTKKILIGDLLARADSSRGKFRNFLLTSLERFSIDRLRAQGVATALPILDPSEPKFDAAIAFDFEWAQTAIVNALRQTRDFCRRKNHANVWRVLFKRVVEPLVNPGNEPSYEELAAACGLRSSGEARNLMLTARRIFQRQVCLVLGEYKGDSDMVQADLRDLRDIIGSPACRYRSLEISDHSSLMNSSLWGHSDHWLEMCDKDVDVFADFVVDEDPSRVTTRAAYLHAELTVPCGELICRHSELDEIPAGVELDELGKRSISDVLFSSNSCLATFDCLRRVYRKRSREIDNRVAQDVSKVLYVATIAAAYLTLAKCISSQPPSRIAKKARKAADFVWLTDDLRELLSTAASEMK